MNPRPRAAMPGHQLAAGNAVGINLCLRLHRAKEALGLGLHDVA